MAKTIIIEEFGGADNMKLVDREVGDPGPGEIRIRHEACGLNFIDVYQRSGVYPLELPHPLGMEGAGVVEAVGEGVTHLAVGDRAAYAGAPPGSYCEERVMKAMQVCKLPDSISFETGAAMMLKGLTTQYLFRSTGRLTGGETVLFHAAAGGVGLIACQWARAMGVRLIGTAGTDEKCKLAESFGADTCINYSTEDWVARVKDLTEEQVRSIRQVIQDEGRVEGDLRKNVQMDIKRLIEIGCYRGSRHRLGLPVRGQRSHTNARTKKGPRVAVAGKKKVTK